MMSLLREFFPYIDKEAQIAVSIGPPPQDHLDICNNTCPDCLWYDWGIDFNNRKESGEFDEIINKRNK